MQLAVHEFLLGVREALTIWLALVALAVVALACMLAPDRIHWLRGVTRRRREAKSRRGAAGQPGSGPGVTGRVRRPPRAGGPLVRRRRLAAHAAELGRYADEIAVAAGRAAVTAERCHEEWVAAQRMQEAAWRAYEAADAAARRVLRAAAFPLPATPRTPAEFADRERYLHRAATDAFRRGELSVDQLRDALSHRNGWDPSRHPFEQDAMVRRAAQHRLLRVYQAAAGMERAAWQAAGIAAAARRSLDDEAFQAAQRARRAHARLAAENAPRRVRIGFAHRPTLATR
jgi:hypothetical protein